MSHVTRHTSLGSCRYSYFLKFAPLIFKGLYISVVGFDIIYGVALSTCLIFYKTTVTIATVYFL